MCSKRCGQATIEFSFYALMRIKSPSGCWGLSRSRDSGNAHLLGGLHPEALGDARPVAPQSTLPTTPTAGLPVRSDRRGCRPGIGRGRFPTPTPACWRKSSSKKTRCSAAMSYASAASCARQPAAVPVSSA